MNITDVIDYLATLVHDGADAHEVVDSWINSATYANALTILDEIGDRDLSEPRPDLREGWPSILKQLAFNALLGAVQSAARRALIIERERLVLALDAAGGRGVEIAERIDEIDRLLGLDEAP